MVYQNKNHEIWRNLNGDIFGAFFDFLVRIYCENIDKEGAKFIYFWLEKVKAEEYKAGIKIHLIDLL